MTDPAGPRRTPLYDRHVALGARMTPFAGFSMPVQYSGIVEEHLAVRKTAGIFDVSHMGEVYVTGPQALDFVQWLVTNDVSTLYDGRAMYTVMCTPDGGIVDDLLVYRFDDIRYMLVINAANIDKDLDWMREQAGPFDVSVENASDRIALIALQGPATSRVLNQVAPGALDDLKYYHFRPDAEIAGMRGIALSRTGYTGEYGVEIYCHPEDAAAIWDALLEAGEAEGVLPAGLGARDTLRLEAGMPLYGNDLDETTNPIEAGLSWVVKPDKGDFSGRRTLMEIVEKGPARRLVGFMLDERGIPRHGYELMAGEEVIGIVTSGSQSPLLQRGIGLGYVRNESRFTAPDAPLAVRVRGRALAAHVARPPFHKN